MKNLYQQTTFIMGTPDSRRVPADEGIEVAFAGRSNAGKSSALNVLTEQKSLARISKAPGRTREINFFAVREAVRLVDLPGYGYAKVSKSMKGEWQRNIARYLETRESLCGVVLLMDVRHPLKEYDQQVLSWCYSAALQTHVLLTKADKLKRGPARRPCCKPARHWKDCTPRHPASYFRRTPATGNEQLQQVLNHWLGLAPPE